MSEKQDSDTGSTDPNRKFWWLIAVVVPLLAAVIGVLPQILPAGGETSTVTHDPPTSVRPARPTSEPSIASSSLPVLYNTEWTGSLKVQDRSLADEDREETLKFYREDGCFGECLVVDIHGGAVGAALTFTRTYCSVSTAEAEVTISCPAIGELLVPVKYRMHRQPEKMAGTMSLDCTKSRLSDKCPPSGTLLYDVQMKRNY